MRADGRPVIRQWLCLILGIPLFVGCGSLNESVFAKMGDSAPKVTSEEFKREISKVGKSSVIKGNEVRTLENGDTYFPRMVEVIGTAKDSIEFEMFAMVDSIVTYNVVVAMIERAKAGVKVRVILDGVGSRHLRDEYVVAMQKAGMDVQWYRPFSYFRMWYGNNRDHRKILIVDGKVGFTGGTGYADSWRGDARNEKEWRDTQYEVRGEAVVEMQRVFEDNWSEITGVNVEHYSNITKWKEGRNSEDIQVVMGAPYDRGDTLGATYLLAIDAAKKFILLEHSYFIPNKKLREALVRASRCGVRVEVILPSDKIDTAVVRSVSKIHWPELMAAGVKIYEFQPSMFHGKLMVVDGEFCVVGSGNFDDRSLFMNDEMNLNIWGKDFVDKQMKMFERDKARSKLMSREDARVKKGERWLRFGGWLIEDWL